MHLFRAVFLDVRKENQSQSTVQIHVLQKRLPDLKEQEQRLIDALVHRREIKQAVFDEQHDRVQQEITLTQMHLNEVSQVELDVEAALNFTQQVLCNAAGLWAAGGAACPRPRPSIGRPIGWAGSSVRQVLLRRLYRGERQWGRTKKRLPSGIKRPHQLPEKDWVVVMVPALEIVPAELWKEAHDRWKNLRQLYLRSTGGRLHGRPTNGH